MGNRERTAGGGPATRRAFLGAAGIGIGLAAGCVGVVGGPRLDDAERRAFEAYKAGKRAYEGAESDFEAAKEAWNRIVQEWAEKDWGRVSSKLEAAETKYGRAAERFGRASEGRIPAAAAERARRASEHAAYKREAMRLYVDAVAAYADENGDRGGRLRGRGAEKLREADRHPAPVDADAFRGLLAER